ncbi:hypothetical protein [Rhodococcus sp. HNM0569]|nr:hypothetical protein [Rhodococcus sp. HNM0569]NLU85106.1 hypothetical protein [Rhodococcus sp. HNM0569]
MTPQDDPVVWPDPSPLAEWWDDVVGTSRSDGDRTSRRPSATKKSRSAT